MGTRKTTMMAAVTSADVERVRKGPAPGTTGQFVEVIAAMRVLTKNRPVLAITLPGSTQEERVLYRKKVHDTLRRVFYRSPEIQWRCSTTETGIAITRLWV